jgi:hypothetical protein
MALGSKLVNERREVAYLDHERGHSALAALRVHLSAADECGLALCESDSLAVPAGDPAAAGNRKKECPTRWRSAGWASGLMMS